MNKDEEHPIVKICDSLDKIEKSLGNIGMMLEKIANPPMMVRVGSETYSVEPGSINYVDRE